MVEWNRNAMEIVVKLRDYYHGSGRFTPKKQTIALKTKPWMSDNKIGEGLKTKM